VHVQDFPARYAPQMGIEGANVLFDTWVHPLMMGLEEHLLGMFKGDAEFHEDAAPSHLGGGPVGAAAGAASAQPASDEVPAPTLQAEAAAPDADKALGPDGLAAGAAAAIVATWAPDAEKELRKIPFFVRGKARRNTERYAQDHRVPVITVETLYDAKAHFSR
jgi:light-independent protochlorophyllide reductase subunit B